MDCDAPAAKAIELVLRHHLKQMCALRDRALDWSDPEGVHDMRVASRRLRSAVADFKPYLRHGILPRDRLKMIAATLGAVRDEDVSLLALESLEKEVDENVAAGIEAIAEERRRRRLQERAALEQAIGEAAIVEFKEDFLSRLETTAHGEPGSRPAREKQTFRRIGVEVIASRLKGLVDGSECIYDPTRMKELHRLRILAKRLRYAIELFSPCWKDEFKIIAKEVARLQTSLGGLHDCDMWIAELGARLKQANLRKGRNRASNLNSDAAIWLLHHFAKERTDHYRDALVRWQDWQASGFLTKLKKLLRKN